MSYKFALYTNANQILDADSVGTTQVATAAITPAKCDLTLSWDFSSGTLRAATPSTSSDVATKAYVDASQVTLDAKNSVRVATTANVTLSGTQTIDGVAVIDTDRVLVKNQTAGEENGIYVAHAGSWTRATDSNSSSNVSAGMYVWVEEGTTNGDTGWILTTNAPIVLNTTALTFTQFSGLGQVTAGAGLTKTGNTLDIGAGTGITVNANDVAVDTTVVATTTNTVTLTNKTLTNPTINAAGGVLIAPSATSPAQTAEGSVVWDSDDDLLTVGTGSSRKILVDTDSTQTLSAKTLTSPTLTNPTINAAGGVLIAPSATSPAQTAEGSVVWDSDDDLFTVGTGSGRKTLVDTDSTQTLSAKTLTNPTINAAGGVLIAPSTTSPAQTAEGSVVWDSDDDLLTVGTGSGRKILVDTSSTQTLTGKTLSGYSQTGVTPAAAAGVVQKGVANINGAATTADVSIYEGNGQLVTRVNGSGSLNVLHISESVADDGTIALAIPSNTRLGVLEIYTPTGDHGTVIIDSNVTISTVMDTGGSRTSNFAIADTDTKLCVFSNAGVPTIKNRLGASTWIIGFYRWA